MSSIKNNKPPIYESVYLKGVSGHKALLKCDRTGKTILGRNVPELKCSDKKVSRHHAFIEIEDDGTVYLHSTHINPCFVSDGESKTPKAVKNNEKAKLENGSTISLLPSQYTFELCLYKLGDKTVPTGGDRSASSSEAEEESSLEDEEFEDSPKKGKRPAARTSRKSVRPQKVDEDEESDLEEEDQSEDEDFEPSSESDWEEETNKKSSKKKSRKRSSSEEEEDESDEDWGTKKRKKSAPAKKSSRRQPSRGTSSRGKYRESDDDDDDEDY